MPTLPPTSTTTSHHRHAPPPLLPSPPPLPLGQVKAGRADVPGVAPWPLPPPPTVTTLHHHCCHCCRHRCCHCCRHSRSGRRARGHAPDLYHHLSPSSRSTTTAAVAVVIGPAHDQDRSGRARVAPVAPRRCILIHRKNQKGGAADSQLAHC
jgi:hypothetical protein